MRKICFLVILTFLFCTTKIPAYASEDVFNIDYMKGLEDFLGERKIVGINKDGSNVWGASTPDGNVRLFSVGDKNKPTHLGLHILPPSNFKIYREVWVTRRNFKVAFTFFKNILSDWKSKDIEDWIIEASNEVRRTRRTVKKKIGNMIIAVEYLNIDKITTFVIYKVKS